MHNLLPEIIKLGSMQGFCHVISDHLISQTISDVNVVFGLLIGDVEVLDVQVTRVLVCWSQATCHSCCLDRGYSP